MIPPHFGPCRIAAAMYTVPCHQTMKNKPRRPCNVPQTASGVALKDSAMGPKEIGMKRGDWYRMVEAIEWYTQSAIAKARFPGRNSGSEKQRKEAMQVARRRDE